MATKKKKKFKLKKKFRKYILFIIIIMIFTFIGLKVYNTYKYHETEYYQFIKLGYDDDTIKLLEDKLSKTNLDYLLNEDKIDYISSLVSEKYYIDNNLQSYLTYYEDNDKKSFKDIVAIVNVGANKDWYEDAYTTDSSGYTILVNKFATLPSDFTPGEIKKFSSTYAYGTVEAEETCYDAFITMAEDARKDGITLILTSGYRSSERQTAIYEEYKSKKGESYADEYAARPGHSEHETGLALDILTYGGTTDTFKETETYAWLHTHAYLYGFIERYKEGTEYLTGYEAEAWHYRYLGVELATKVYEEGITYDEYYAFYLAGD